MNQDKPERSSSVLGQSVNKRGFAAGEGQGLVRLAMNADFFIAHNAVPEEAIAVERRLHMPPSVIGQIAEDVQFKRLVLSHRMLGTLAKEDTLNQTSINDIRAF